MNTETNPQIDQSRYNTMVTFYFDGQPIRILLPIAPLGYYPRNPQLKISFAPVASGAIAPIIYLHEGLTMMEDLCKASGLKSYDPALPWEWVKAEYLSKGLDCPRGVWSYDDNRFGSFVPIETMLSRVGQRIAELIGYDGLTILNHGWDFDPSWHVVQPGDFVTLRIGEIDHPNGARVIDVVSTGIIRGQNEECQRVSTMVCLNGSTYMYSDDMTRMLQSSNLRVRIAPVTAQEEMI